MSKYSQLVKIQSLGLRTPKLKRLTWSDFQKVEMRIGTILYAEIFKEARNPAYKITVDFGELGTRKTSAQVTVLYNPEDLIGKQE